MKNIDYEKKYNEALNWMRELYPGLHGETKEDAEHYFPELKESEENKDERIRKAVVELVKRTPSSMFDADTVGKWIGASHDEILAYLEKQKEHIPYIDFVIKPHKGDDTNPYDMGASEAQDYIIKRGFSNPFIDGEVYVDERHIIQTIGNILKWADEHPKEQKPSINIDQLKSLMLQYLQEAANEKNDSDIEADTDKWARKILGYNFEQKPITINQDEKEFLAEEITAFLCNYDKEFDGEDPVPSEVAEHFYLLGKQAQEQKPADEQFPPLEGLDAIKAKYYDDGFKNGFDEGVESVKPAEWSKNDTVFLNEITDFFENHTIRLQHDLDMYAHWLKSLPERFNLQPKPEQKPEVKMKWFVARDSCNRDDCGLAAYKHKPFRASAFWVNEYSLDTIKLPWQAFPDLKWEDEPMEVEIIIRKK